MSSYWLFKNWEGAADLLTIFNVVSCLSCIVLGTFSERALWGAKLLYRNCCIRLVGLWWFWRSERRVDHKGWLDRLWLNYKVFRWVS